MAVGVLKAQTTGRERVGHANFMPLNFNQIKSKPVFAVTRTIAVVDKIASLFDGTHAAVADVLYKFWSVEQFKNKLRVDGGVEFTYCEPFGFEDWHSRVRKVFRVP